MIKYLVIYPLQRVSKKTTDSSLGLQRFYDRAVSNCAIPWLFTFRVDAYQGS